MIGIKSLAMIVVTAFSFSAPVLAKGGLDLPKALQKRLEAAAAKHAGKQADPRANDCQNFSGNWAGSCTDSDGETYDSTFAIEQDGCDDLYLGDLTVPPGGEATAGHASRRSLHSMKVYPQWSSSRNSMTLRISYSGRAIGEDVYYSGRGGLTMQIIDGRLVTRSATEVEFDYFGQVDVSHYTDECTYTRQN